MGNGRPKSRGKKVAPRKTNRRVNLREELKSMRQSPPKGGGGELILRVMLSGLKSYRTSRNRSASRIQKRAKK